MVRVLALLSVLSSTALAQDLTITTETSIVTPSTVLRMDQSSVPVEILSSPANSPSLGFSPAESLQQSSQVSVTSNGGRHQTSQVSIRGAAGDHSLVLLDSMEMNDPMHPGRGTNLSLIGMHDVGKIEILPAAYSVLYGSDALGGVVRFSTKPLPAESRTRLSLEGGSHLYGGAAVTHENSTLRAGVTWSQSEGYSAVKTKDAEDDGHRALGANFYSEYMIRDIRLSFKSHMYDLHLDQDNGNGPNDDDPNHRSHNFTAANQLGAAFNWKGLESKVELQHHFVDRIDDNNPDAKHPGEDFHSHFQGQTAKVRWLNHLRYAQTNSGLSTVHFGVEYEYEDGFSKMSDALFGDSRFPRKNQDQFAGFVLLEAHYGKSDVIVGWRSDFFSEYDFQGNYSVGLGYEIWDKWVPIRAFANGSTGFKTPSLFQRYSTFGSKDLKPETSDSANIGLQFTLARDCTLSGDYFQNEYDELIDFDFTANKYQNLKDVKIEGMTTSVDCTYQQWRGKTSYVRLWPEKDKRRTLLRRPSYKITASASYKVAQSLSAELTAQQVGERYDNTATNQTIVMDPYLVFNLGARYGFSDRYTGFLRVNNVLNENYEEIYHYATGGRELYAGIEATF